MNEIRINTEIPVADDSEIRTTIRIDFAKESPDPARIFRAMSGLIEAFIQLDRDLAHSVAANVEPVVLLENVEASSLKAILRTVLKTIDDEALHNLDWKPLVGQFLVRGKHAILRRLGDSDTIETKQQLTTLQQEIHLIAQQTNVVNVHVYEPVPPKALLADLEHLGAALSHLLPQDATQYIASGEVTPINPRFRLSDDQVETLLTDEVTSKQDELVLKIKKPDYLGTSMWDFYYDGRPFQAKIVDEVWLREFQARRKNVRPGDALRTLVRTEVKRSSEGVPVASRHFVERVLEIIGADPNTQEELFPPPEAV